jgi:hypothetical protein
MRSSNAVAALGQIRPPAEGGLIALALGAPWHRAANGGSRRCDLRATGRCAVFEDLVTLGRAVRSIPPGTLPTDASEGSRNRHSVYAL